ncbi:MAG: TadE/TadG family type IV pilus assembly protein [Propionibacteriaceae bacterium]
MNRDDRGAAALEAVLLIPLFVLVAMLAVLGGRLAWARSGIESTAQDAARAVAMERGPAEGQRRGLRLAQAGLADLPCRDPRIDVDAVALARAAGSAGEVSVNITCTVSLHDLVLPGVPGQIAVTSRGTAVIDTYRKRG